MGGQLEDEWTLQRVDILELLFELLDRVEMFQQDSRVEPLDSAVLFAAAFGHPSDASLLEFDSAAIEKAPEVSFQGT